MHESQEQLQESHRMLKTLISNLPGIVCRFKNDMDWTMEFISDGCYELTGYQPEELVGNRTVSFGNITHQQDNIEVWAMIQSALKAQSKYQVEYRITTKLGDQKWLWEQGSAIYDDAGKVVAIEAFITDITKQKTTECDLHSTIKELGERNLELDTFTYRISHDIRSPLLTIYGLTALMKLEITNPDLIEYCDRIDGTTKKLDLFTKDLLIYSRSKEYKEKPEKIDFDRLIHEALQDSGFPNYMSLVNFEIDIQLEREVVSEAFRLKVILGNLLSNAIKYRDKSKLASCLKVTVRSTSKELVIKMEDNGIGISKEHQEEVFKMFFRATEVSEGSGLGLYIVKMNVNKLNGTITCSGVEGEGTTFLLTFPMQK